MARVKGTGLKRSYLEQLKFMTPGEINAQGRGGKKQLAMQMIASMKTRARTRGRPLIGKLYHYQYDPKHKLTLPYYDLFPVMIPVRYYPDGWLGLNFHYLDQFNRAALLDRLTAAYQVGKKETTRLQISYDLLKGASTLEAFQPCLKRYLVNHVKTQPLEIDRSDWFLAITLPLAKFVKATESKVHADSRRRIRD